MRPCRALDGYMDGTLELIDVIVDGQRFTGLYRVSNGVLTLKFSGRELIGLIRSSGDPATLAERMMLAALNDNQASRLKGFARKL